MNVPAPEVIGELVKESKDGKTLTLQDLASARVKREQTLAKPLDDFTAGVARGEAINLLRTMGDGVNVSVERVKVWLGEERLPDDYSLPKATVGLFAGETEKGKMKVLMDEITGNVKSK